MARRGFADLFSIFTSRDDDDEIEDDPITELIKRREAQAEQRDAKAPSAGREDVSRAIQAAQAPSGDVMRDEMLDIEVRGKLDPLMRAELRQLFEQFKRQKGIITATATSAKEPLPERDGRSLLGDLGDDSAGDDEDDDDDFDPDDDLGDDSAGDDDSDDDVGFAPPPERFAKAREFEAELEARRREIQAHQREREAARARPSNPRRRTRKRKKR